MAQEQAKNSPADRIAEYRFAPGQSGNPGGRPKGPSLKRAVEKRLGEVAPASIIAKLNLPDGSTWCDVLAETTMRAAVANEHQARKLVFEYVEGKATQPIELTGANGGPIAYADANNEADLDAEFERVCAALEAAESAGRAKPARRKTAPAVRVRAAHPAPEAGSVPDV
jgi:hypothetical protein